MLKLKLQGGQELIAAMRDKPSTLLSVLSVKLNALMIMLSRYVVAEKLSGQVLKRQTGKLAASVHHVPASIEGTKVSGFVEAAGPGAPYGTVHEHGGERAYEIAAVNRKALHFVMGGREVWLRRVTHPAAVARPFMSTSLEENKSEIVSQLQDALTEALKRK